MGDGTRSFDIGERDGLAGEQSPKGIFINGALLIPAGHSSSAGYFLLAMLASNSLPIDILRDIEKFAAKSKENEIGCGKQHLGRGPRPL
jgi:hypothetical protein